MHPVCHPADDARAVVAGVDVLTVGPLSVRSIDGLDDRHRNLANIGVFRFEFGERFAHLLRHAGIVLLVRERRLRIARTPGVGKVVRTEVKAPVTTNSFLERARSPTNGPPRSIHLGTRRLGLAGL